MTASADLRVLFRAPAGPRRGFGHLVRCRSLARALGVRPLIAIRGGQPAACGGARARLRRRSTDAPAAVDRARGARTCVVVDDPIAADARRWIACARRAGCRVVTVHDLGLGCVRGRPRRRRQRRARGDMPQAGYRPRSPQPRVARAALRASSIPAFASPLRAARHGRARRACSIALGGGPRAALAYAIARAVAARRCRGRRIRIAGGFAPALCRPIADRIAWTGPLDGLAGELARATSPSSAAVCPSTKPARAAWPRWACRSSCRSGRRCAASSPRARRSATPAAASDAERRGARGGAAAAPAGAAEPRSRRRGRQLVDGRGAGRVARCGAAAGRPATIGPARRPGTRPCRPCGECHDERRSSISTTRSTSASSSCRAGLRRWPTSSNGASACRRRGFSPR